MIALVLLGALTSAPARAVLLSPEVDAIVEENAALRRVDPLLVRAVIWRESGGDPRATGSPVGRGRGRAPKDFGLMQLRRGAATRGLDLTREQLFDPEINVYLGVWYLADRVRECGGVARGLGGYSSGKCKVNKYARTILRDYRMARRSLLVRTIRERGEELAAKMIAEREAAEDREAAWQYTREVLRPWPCAADALDLIRNKCVVQPPFPYVAIEPEKEYRIIVQYGLPGCDDGWFFSGAGACVPWPADSAGVPWVGI